MDVSQNLRPRLSQEPLDQLYLACLYLFECVRHAEFKYGNENLNFWKYLKKMKIFGLLSTLNIHMNGIKIFYHYGQRHQVVGGVTGRKLTEWRLKISNVCFLWNLDLILHISGLHWWIVLWNYSFPLYVWANLNPFHVDVEWIRQVKIVKLHKIWNFNCHYHIWIQHEKWVKMSINKPSIGAVVPEVAHWFWEKSLKFQLFLY